MYACLKVILCTEKRAHKNKQYRALRDTFVGAVSRNAFQSGEDYGVALADIPKFVEVFRINIFVLKNAKPHVEMIDNTVNFDDYRSIRKEYVVSWECHHNPIKPGSRFEIASATPYEKGYANSCMFYVINGERYYVVVYGDGHYHVVNNLVMPEVCVRCGSFTHTAAKADADDQCKFECLANLAAYMSEAALRKEGFAKHVVIFDFETVPVDARHTPYLVCYRVYDLLSQKLLDEGEFEGRGCEDKFFEYAMTRYTGMKYLVAYNGSAFDNHFLLKSMVRRRRRLTSDNSIIYKNKILKMFAKNVVVWDLCQFTKCTLDDAAKSFKLGGEKPEMTHEEIWKVFEDHGYDFKKVTADERYVALGVRAYCKKDVEITAELFFVVRRALKEITGVDPLTRPTLSSLSYAHLSRWWKENEIVIDPVPIEYDDVFSSVPGGRTQALERGSFGDDSFCVVDVNSLYPYICMNNDFPLGPVSEVRGEPSSGLYVTLCDVDQTSLKYKLVGCREENKRLNWTKDRVEGVWLWCEELRVLRNHGCDVRVYKSLVWPSKGRIFGTMNAYQKVRFDAKDEGNKSLELMAKTLGNGNTGKLIEKNHDDIWSICFAPYEVESFLVGCYQPESFEVLDVGNAVLMRGKKVPKVDIIKPRHLGCRVYALARLYVWENMMKFEQVFYIDTDSLLVRKSEIEKISLDDREYGAFKIEEESSVVKVVSPKNYMIGTKMRCKGYRKGDTWKAQTKDGEVLATGNELVPELYDYLLRDDVEVYTSFHKISKSFVKKEGGEWELFVVKGTEVQVLLK
jgi:hypothetical protein